MLGRTRKYLLGLLVVVLPLACARLPQSQDGPDLQNVTLPQPGSIPTAWGELVSVTTHAAAPHLEWLWFQDDDGVIRIAFLDNRSQQLTPAVTVIPRS